MLRRALCLVEHSAVAILKFLILEQKVPPFRFALDPANFGADPVPSTFLSHTPICIQMPSIVPINLGQTEL